MANGFPRDARAVSLALNLAATYRALFIALYVVDRRWADILGDEWISTARVRKSFYRYLGNELKNQAQVALESISGAGGQLGLEVKALIKTGIPEKVIVECCTGFHVPDLLVLPYPPGKDVEGALKLHPGKILGRVPCPVLMVPANFRTPPAHR